MARGGAALILLLMTLLTGCVSSRPVSTVPPPAALPAAVASPSQRALSYPNGQWILFGNGTPRSPYAWVWVPTGATPPSAR